MVIEDTPALPCKKASCERPAAPRTREQRARWLLTFVFGAFLVLPLLLHEAPAQVRIDVAGVGSSVYPIAIANFSVSTPSLQAITRVIRNDLSHSGSFQVTEISESLQAETRTDGLPQVKKSGASALLRGSVSELLDGRYAIHFRLDSTTQGTGIGQGSITIKPSDLRYGAHRVADWVYQKLTGEKGIFCTRLAFVSKQGWRYKLNVSDWDGNNILSPLTSSEPIISPSWSPDGSQLAYVSFEEKKPVVYVHHLSTGRRRIVADFKGSNSAPTWSPDAKSLAVTLTKDGSSQIYLVNADGSGAPKQLAVSSGIDTEPTFSPDGQTIYFSSDRGGSPQIYRIPSSGGMATRVTFTGRYNVSPHVSPDGSALVYITQQNGRFFVALQPIGSDEQQLLSETGEEESPSFSPNGRWVLYATHDNLKDALVAVNLSGALRLKLSTSAGDIREPVWGPALY